MSDSDTSDRKDNGSNTKRIFFYVGINAILLIAFLIFTELICGETVLLGTSLLFLGLAVIFIFSPLLSLLIDMENIIGPISILLTIISCVLMYYYRLALTIFTIGKDVTLTMEHGKVLMGAIGTNGVALLLNAPNENAVRTVIKDAATELNIPGEIVIKKLTVNATSGASGSSELKESADLDVYKKSVREEGNKSRILVSEAKFVNDETAEKNGVIVFKKDVPPKNKLTEGEGATEGSRAASTEREGEGATDGSREGATDRSGETSAEGEGEGEGATAPPQE